MFIPLQEVPSKMLGYGEERHYFLFHERDSDLPVEVVITRLPPLFGAEKNWHKHDFVEEFSVPLTGEVIIHEKVGGKQKSKKLSESLLAKGEWIKGIECSDSSEARLYIDSVSGNLREQIVKFEDQYSEGKDWHKVENPSNEMVTMLTMKRVSKRILKKDPLIFRVDRSPQLEDR